MIEAMVFTESTTFHEAPESKLEVDWEFKVLHSYEHRSGCDNKHIAAATWTEPDAVTGQQKLMIAVNYCDKEGDKCPRLNLPPGSEVTDECKHHHAEENLAIRMKQIGARSAGVAWVLGASCCCEKCVTALKDVGVHEMRIREEL